MNRKDVRSRDYSTCQRRHQMLALLGRSDDRESYRAVAIQGTTSLDGLLGLASFDRRMARQ